MPVAISVAVPQLKPLEDLSAYLPKSAIMEYRKGQPVYAAEQSVDRLYLVVEGRIIVSRVVGGDKQVVVAICQPHEIFGEPALVHCFSRSEQAVALENSKVMSWAASQIMESATSQSRLGIVLLQVLAQRESEFTWRMESLAVDTIHRRVARSLIRLSERIGTGQEDGSTRIAPLTHKMLSQYVGSTREIVTHHMTEFRKMGYLTYSRHGIVIYRDALLAWLQQNARGGFPG